MEDLTHQTMVLGEFLRRQFVERGIRVFHANQLQHVVQDIDLLQRALEKLGTQGKVRIWAEVIDPATGQAVWDGLLTEAIDKFKREEFDKDFQFAPRLQLTDTWVGVLKQSKRE